MIRVARRSRRAFARRASRVVRPRARARVRRRARRLARPAARARVSRFQRFQISTSRRVASFSTHDARRGQGRGARGDARGPGRRRARATGANAARDVESDFWI